MALARAPSYDELRSAPDFSPTDAWLWTVVLAKAYAHPSGADREQFVTVGKRRKRPWRRTGCILVNPETKAVNIAWSSDAGI